MFQRKCQYTKYRVWNVFSSSLSCQLRRPAAPPPAPGRRLLLLKWAKAARCRPSCVTLSTRTASSESSESCVPRWQNTTATTPRHRSLRSSSGRAQQEVGLWCVCGLQQISAAGCWSEIFCSSISDKFHGDLYLTVKLLLPGVVKSVYNLNDKQIVKLFSRTFRCNQDDMVRDLEQVCDPHVRKQGPNV